MLIGFMSQWMMSYEGARVITTIAEILFFILVFFAIIGIIATIKFFKRKKK